MKKNNEKKITITPDDLCFFKQMLIDIKPLFQDRIKPSNSKQKKNIFSKRRLIQEQADAYFYFSNKSYQPFFNKNKPLQYIRADTSFCEIKKLWYNDCIPELFLDLHGLTINEAKQELSALIATCRYNHIYCACIIHGHGRQILKQHTPIWLARHPDIKGFHQAPKKFGGAAALLVLIELTR